MRDEVAPPSDDAGVVLRQDPSRRYVRREKTPVEDALSPIIPNKKLMKKRLKKRMQEVRDSLEAQRRFDPSYVADKIASEKQKARAARKREQKESKNDRQEDAPADNRNNGGKSRKPS